MGAIIAKFRKEKTTYQLLEKLEREIKGIEEFSVSTQERQKRFVGSFLVISIGLYVIGFVIFYFLFLPPTWQKKILYSLPLLVFPVIILVLKRLVAWFFQIKLNKNSKKLSTLKAEKKKIIEKVMDKETYKVALELLNRFADKPYTPQPTNTTATSTTGALTPRTPSGPSGALTLRTGQPPPRPFLTPMHGPQKPNQFLTPTRQSVGGAAAITPVRTVATYRQQPLTPFPIVSQNTKGVLEKVVDYIIGDGPSSRYGMICKECFEHNGMASQEQFEYAPFKCAFCKTLNPARKLRPIAPRLLGEQNPSNANGNSARGSCSDRASSAAESSSSASENSGSDTEVPVTRTITTATTTDVVEPKTETDKKNE